MFGRLWERVERENERDVVVERFTFLAFFKKVPVDCVKPLNN